MTNRWLTGIAVAALTAAGTMAAQAADLPTRKEAPAPVFVPPPFTWTGFYVGINAGASWSMGSRTTSLYDPAFGFLGTYYPGNLGSSNTGFIGGGQAGYNWQTGAFVLGVETDFDGTTQSKTFNYTSAPIAGGVGVPPALAGDTLYVNAKASLDWLGTTRARLGFVATPDNRLMFYATGGVAYGGGSANYSAYDATQGLFWTGSPSSSRVGWTFGGGVEYAITNNITIKGEYLYYNLGSTSFSSPVTGPFATPFPNVVAVAKYTFDGSIVRAGVNYKF
jgi:outer membrane immunogenic protein